ncbi:MAG: DNA primase [Rikenellaceae bacterium]|nr:DNA primase [Rikenellaceae bacterium]MCL2691964.1 DNA primase [Rikenellaceae bacterium]
MIDKATVDRIYSAANVVEIVGDFVTLKKKGVNYQACCPFHSEKTPSFVVSPTKGLFKCFGCGKGGNAVTFVMEHEGMTYPEALKYVARKYGIEVEERELSPEETRRNDDRESMLIVSRWAAEWFEQQMTDSDEGRSVALSYFRGRGFTDEIIKKFGLGYCPASGEAMTKAALGAGYREEFLVGTGLTVRRDDGRLYDRFFGRVMFPIHSVSGRVTAFGGRTMRSDKRTAKYVNSPESEIYHKSNVLYGLFFAKKAMAQQDRCILVEGYTDVISMYQAGVENVVASSGTSLTTEQIRLIARFTKNITVIYDGDAAGVAASLRGIDMILREGLNVRVVPLPEGEDPDSFARGRGGAEVREYIEASEEDFIAFKTRALLVGAGRDPLRRAEVVTDIVASIAEIPDPIVRSLYIRETAVTLDVEQQLVAGEVARKRISHGSDRQTREFIRSQQELRRAECFSESGESSSETAAAASRGITGGSSMDELEKELVKYLIKYGDRYFDYKEGRNMVSLNVAAIIINDLDANGLVLQNMRYKSLYDSYIELYEKRMAELEADEERRARGEYEHQMRRSDDGAPPPLPQIGLHHFINHPDPEVCNAAVDILTDDENYVVSKLWEKHDIVVTSEADRLSDTVPRLVILYKSKAIEAIIDTLKQQLRDEALSDEALADVTYRIAALNKERMTIARKLSRLIL